MKSEKLTKKEKVLLHAWPKYLFRNILEITPNQTYHLNRMLQGNSTYDLNMDLELAILDKTFWNTTKNRLTPLMGVFHTLMFFDFEKQGFKPEVLYDQFKEPVVEFLQPLTDSKVINTKEDFISTLIVINLQNRETRERILSDISTGTKATLALSSLVNNFPAI